MPQTRTRQNSSTNQDSETQKKQDEADRYRQAAEDALQQLDWAIGYLHGIRKTEISRALAKNRTFIRRELMGRPEEPVPSQQTDQT